MILFFSLKALTLYPGKALTHQIKMTISWKLALASCLYKDYIMTTTRC